MNIRDIKTEIIGSINAITDSIKAKGVEVAEGTRPRELANKVVEVYDKATVDFWDVIQFNGTRTHYAYAFSRWDAEYIRPKHKVIPTDANGVGNIFANCSNLKKVEAEYFDFSQKPSTNNNNGGYYYSFDSCTSLEEIEDIGLIAQHNCYYTFRSCRKLHTIAKLGVDENTKYLNTFNDCTSIVNLTIDGTIGQNGFDIHWSTGLSAASIYSIISALSTTTTGLIITLPASAPTTWNTGPRPNGAPATWDELAGNKDLGITGIRPNWDIVLA